MGSLSVNIQLTFKDFYGFQVDHLKKRGAPLYIYLFLMGVVFLCSYLKGTDPDSDDLFFALFLMLFPLILIVVIFFNARKNFQNDPTLREEKNYLLNSEGLEAKGENSFCRTEWKDVYKYHHSTTGFLVYLSPQKAFILPKRYFDQDEAAFVLSLLKEKVKEKKRPFRFIRPVLYCFACVVLLLFAFSTFSTDSANGPYRTGYMLEKKGNYRAAIIEYSKALLVDSTSAEIYLHRAFSKGNLGDYAGEILDCNKAIELNKDYGSAYSNRGFARFQLGDSTGACQDLQTAVKLGDKFAKEAISEYCGGKP